MFKKCHNCKKRLGSQRFIIVERDRPRQGAFCSLDCIDAFLAKHMPTWKAMSAFSRIDPKRKKIRHTVRIEPKGEMMLYRDRTS